MTQSTTEFSKTEVEGTAEKTPIRVLHVDDDAGFLKTAKQILEMQGAFQVDTAQSVKEAVEKMKKEEYDVVVSDYLMPGKDGLQFLKELREKGNSIPFIIFTGKGREGVVIKALNLGADLYVNKTGDPETVYSELSHGVINVARTRRAEDDLRVQREELQTILDSMPAKIWYKDKDNRLLRVNKAFAEYMGVSKKDLEGKLLGDLFPPDIAQKCWEEDKEVIATGQSKTDILDRHESAQGVRWFSTGKVPCRERDGNITGTINFSADITESKITEDRLKESEKKYRQLVENIHEGIWVIDKDAYTTFVNPRMAEILRYDIEEMKGRHLFSFMDERGVEICKRYLERRKQGIKEQHDCELLRKDGTRVYVTLETAPITDDNGNYIGALASVMDVTERKKAEEALRENEEKWKCLTENSPDHIMLLDRDAKIRYINHTVPDLTTEKVLGKSMYDYVPSEFRKVVADCIENVLETGKPSSYTTEYHTKKGEIRHFDVRVAPVFQSGKVVGLISNSTDITERKKAKVALQESEERFRAIVENAPFGYYRVGKDGLWQYVNPVWERMHGLSLEEVVGKPFEITQTEDSVEQAKEYVKRALAGETIIGEFSRLTGEGDIEYHSFNIQPVKRNNEIVAIEGFINDISERKKAEEQSRKTSEELSRTFDAITDLLFIVDRDYRLVRVNTKLCEVLKKKPEELVGKRCYEVVHGTDKPVPNCPHKRTLETKKATSEEINDPNLGIPLLVTNSPVFDERGEIIQCVHVAKDITERKKSEESLRNSEEKFRNIFESATDVMILLDITGKILDVNKKAVEAFGGSKGELVGKHFTRACLGIMSPTQISKVVKGFAVGLTNKKPNLDVSIKNKKGQTILLECSGSLLKLDDKSTGLLVVGRDITERKRAEEELTRSEAKYRSLVEQSLQGIVVAQGPAPHLVFANRAISKMLGYTPEELTSLSPQETTGLVHPEDRDVFFGRFKDRLEGKPALSHYEVRGIKKDGTVMWLELSSTGIEYNGHPAVQATFLNITERKKVLERLRVLNEKLGVVGGLTRHDVRNKLFNVTNNIYLAKQLLPDDHKALAYLREIESACDQTTRILDFAATYESLGVEQLALVDMGKAVEEAASLFSDLQDVKVVNECHGLGIMADSLLSQLFYNLFDNSLKHGEKVSRISVHYQEGKDGLKLLYEDDGVGIPKAIKPKIFAEGLTTDKGFGYGLHLVKRMLEVYGWTIAEEGKPGKGVKFVITIPKTNPNGKENYQLS